MIRYPVGTQRMRGMYHTRNSHTICQEQVLKKSIYIKLLNVMCMLYWTNGVKKWNWKQEFVFFSYEEQSSSYKTRFGVF